MSLLFRFGKSPAQLFDRWPAARGATLVGDDMTSPMRFIPVYAAVALISEAVACTPVHAYRSTTAGRQRVDSQPQLLVDPLPGFNRFVWVQQLMTSILLRGNAFGLVLNRDNLGFPTQLRWLNPTGMRVDTGPAGLPVYVYNGREIERSQIVHIPGVTLPGSVVGLSPISLFRTQIETGLSVDRFTGDWFETGVAPTGHLKNTATGHLDPDTALTAKESFRAAVRNHDFFVSGSEWEWKALTIPAQDAQFLDTMKASATQIATIYRLAPEDIGGERGNSLTYKTLEQDELRFNRRTLLPWTTRVEAVLSQLLPRGQYVKFNLDSQVRADLKTRMEAHQIALRMGIEVLDEVRALEDKPPLTADEFAAWQKYMQAVNSTREQPANTRDEGRLQ